MSYRDIQLKHAKTKAQKDRIKEKAKKKRLMLEDKKRTNIAIQKVYNMTLLILRNQGWGRTRLKRFSEKFDQMLTDVNNGLVSLNDIIKTVESETDAIPGEYDITV